jgi:hypothetical protein
LCRYNQHDLSASGFAAGFVLRDGYHLPYVVVVVWGGCAGVFVVGTVLFIAIVATCGVIFVGCGCWVGTVNVTFLLVSGVLVSTWRANMSSSFSISSSSESDCSKKSSAGCLGAVGIPCCVFNFIRNLAHGVVPSMSSMCLSLLLVLVI